MTGAADDSLREMTDRVATQLKLAFEEGTASPARQRKLNDILATAVKSIGPDQRDRFLVGLQRRFPTLEVADSVATTTSPAAAPLDAEALKQRLLELGPSMSESQRRDIASTFAAWLPASPSAAPSTTPASRDVKPPRIPPQSRPGRSALIAAMGVGPVELDEDRLAMALALLWDLSIELEALGWNVWKHTFDTGTLEPPLRRRLELRATLLKYLAGQLNAPPDVMVPAVAELRGLIAGLVVAAQKEATDAPARLVTLHPQDVEAAVDGTGSASRQRAAYWAEYCERAKAANSPLLRNTLEEMVKTIVEHIPGRRAPGKPAS